MNDNHWLQCDYQRRFPLVIWLNKILNNQKQNNILKKQYIKKRNNFKTYVNLYGVKYTLLIINRL